MQSGWNTTSSAFIFDLVGSRPTVRPWDQMPKFPGSAVTIASLGKDLIDSRPRMTETATDGASKVFGGRSDGAGTGLGAVVATTLPFKSNRLGV